MLETRRELAADPLVAHWVEKGWPLIGRRAVPGEARGIPLGLPLPPSAGKRRLSFVLQPEEIVSTAPPPALGLVVSAAPRAWRCILERVVAVASQHSLEPRVFGSLAWRALTGLPYVTDTSDLDLLLHIHRSTDILRLVADLAAIQAAAPMRLDGELVREDGAAVNWRELSGGARAVLVKTHDEIALRDAGSFLCGEIFR
ncbi:malonate decarboxylase holo-[acyl-carrier-protein] synthase [Phyllobacterium zundukense]|uniref:Malonate decarboxylase holo-[acyl-carrier-protein] synthase n=1 Tax=Phyllobacterium zundukense TaxID=1867719 RepID=A0ACD4CXX9_9HYPH|nr:malonate decarboxylase holo-[acyl-carrier-protein] synthase [Phyllobacterium zundukense]UXN58477.1 malonate decarboxylase holo-[acyl-carrier-protein] synthase [Phyllobacterium zundukense]